MEVTTQHGQALQAKVTPTIYDSLSAPKALIFSHLQRLDINIKVYVFLTFSTSDIMDQMAESPGMDSMG